MILFEHTFETWKFEMCDGRELNLPSFDQCSRLLARHPHELLYRQEKTTLVVESYTKA